MTQQSVQLGPNCDYCGKRAVPTDGKVIYPHRSDLAHLKFWACFPCKAHVGCHKGTAMPLGRLANAALRKAKQAAHAAFDPTWQNKGKSARRASYQRLAAALGIDDEDCHIGMFDEAMCKRVIEEVRKWNE